MMKLGVLVALGAIGCAAVDEAGDNEGTLGKGDTAVAALSPWQGHQRALVVLLDWSNVDFEDEPTAEPGKGISIVFAGNRYFSGWSQHLPDFYVRSGGTRPNLMEDARAARLIQVLKRVETVDSIAPPSLR